LFKDCVRQSVNLILLLKLHKGKLNNVRLYLF
jgi:hypothetical protein